MQNNMYEEYDLTLDYSYYTRIVLIDGSLPKQTVFSESSNSRTYPIIYGPHHSIDRLQQFIITKFINLKRIAILNHGPSNVNKIFRTPQFIQNKQLFLDSDLYPGANIHTFSPITKMLYEIINSTPLERLDFLGCNLLQLPKWVLYFDLLKNMKSQLIIGASNNNTGNVQYGGDWNMENTNENIKNVYFVSSLISLYSRLLLSDTFSQNNRTYTFTYETGNPSCTITYLDNTSGNVIIPGTMQDSEGNSYTVTATSWLFFNRNDVTSITIPTTVTEIYTYFARQSSIQSLTFLEPSSCSKICEGAFWDCDLLTKAPFPLQSLLEIGPYAFFDCDVLVNVIIPNTVTTIGGQSLSNLYSLVALTIPDSVTTITQSIAQFMTSNPIMTSSNYDTTEGFSICTNSNIEVLTVGNGLNYIPRGDFSNCPKLDHITIGSSVQNIGQNSFYNFAINTLSPYPIKFVFHAGNILNDNTFIINSSTSSSYFSRMKINIIDGESEYKYINTQVTNISELKSLPNTFNSQTAVSSGNYKKIGELPQIQQSESGSVEINSFAGSIDITDASIVGTTTEEQREYTFNQMKRIVKQVSSNNGFSNQSFFEIKNAGQLPGLQKAYETLKVVRRVPGEIRVTQDICSPGSAIYVALEIGEDIEFTNNNATNGSYYTFTRINKTTYTSVLSTENISRNHIRGSTTFLDNGNKRLEITFGSTEAFYTYVPNHFQINSLNSAITLSKTSEIFGSVEDISANATITLNTTVSKHVLQNTFFYKNDIHSSLDLNYYVDTNAWSNAQDTLNPKNGKIVSTTDGAYRAGDTISKDYLRDLAKQLFGTIIAVDIFANESEVTSGINSKCDEIALNLYNKLLTLNTSSATLSLTDTNNYKYATEDTSEENITRELLTQMVEQDPNRFANISDYLYNNLPEYYKIPFIGGDILSYKVIVKHAVNQLTEISTGRTQSLIDRVYKINLNVTD